MNLGLIVGLSMDCSHLFPPIPRSRRTRRVAILPPPPPTTELVPSRPLSKLGGHGKPQMVMALEDLAKEGAGSTQRSWSQIIVCDECGHVGYGYLLMSCNGCNKAAKHQYCMEKVVFDGSSIDWYCYECQPRNSDMLAKESDFLCLPSEHVNLKNRKSGGVIPVLTVENHCGPSRQQDQSYSSSLIETSSKANIVLETSARALELSDTMHNFLKDIPRERRGFVFPGCDCDEEEQEIANVQREDFVRDNPRKRRQPVLLDGDGDKEEKVADVSTENSNSQSLGYDRSIKKNRVDTEDYMEVVEIGHFNGQNLKHGNPMKEQKRVQDGEQAIPLDILMAQHSELTLPPKKRRTYLQEHEVEDYGESNAGADNARCALSDVAKLASQTLATQDQLLQSRVAFDLEYVDQQCNIYSQPIDEPVWSGIFKVNNKVCVKLVAHWSTKACKRKWELTNLLKPTVEVMKIPLSEAWPEKWRTSGPTDESIGLFFFSHSARPNKELDRLVEEIIDTDAVLKIVIDGSEMLIFASTLLPAQNHGIPNQPSWLATAPASPGPALPKIGNAALSSPRPPRATPSQTLARHGRPELGSCVLVVAVTSPRLPRSRPLSPRRRRRLIPSLARASSLSPPPSPAIVRPDQFRLHQIFVVLLLGLSLWRSSSRASAMPPRVPATARCGRPGRRVPRRTRAPIRASLVSLSPRQVPPGLLFQGKHYLWGTFKCWEEGEDRSDEVFLGLTAAEERELQEHGCLKQQCEAKCTRRSQRLNLEVACESSRRAVDATVERFTKTEFTLTVIDTSTDGWKATELIIRKGTIRKMQDKMTLGVSVPEVLNKGKRRASLVSKLKRIRQKKKDKQAALKGKLYLRGMFKRGEDGGEKSNEVVLALAAAKEREVQQHGCLKQQCEVKCEPSDEEAFSGDGRHCSGAGPPSTTPFALVTAETRRSQRLNLEMACERSHWAVDATVERSTKTEFTISIIDTSTDRWKATKLITHKGTIWKMQDKMTSGVSVPEVLNKVKRKASLVSKLKRDRKEQEKNKQAALQPRIGRKLNEVEEKMACKTSHHAACAGDKRSTKTKVTVMDTSTEGWKPIIGCKLDDAEEKMACKSSHWAANANGERSANTDVTVIDTSSDEWKSSCSEPAPEG